MVHRTTRVRLNSTNPITWIRSMFTFPGCHVVEKATSAEHTNPMLVNATTENR